MATALEKIQNKLKSLESSRKIWWTPEEGESRIRIHRSWKGKNGLFYKEVPTHYSIGPDRDRSFVCAGKKCPGCKRCAKWSKSKDKKKQKRAKRMMVQDRIIMQISLLNDPKNLKLWSTSPTNLQELLGYYVDSDYGDFTDSKRGYNVIVVRKGKKLRTRYKIRLEKNPSKFKFWKKIKKKLINLDERFARPSPGRFKKIMLGLDTRESEDD